MNAERFVIAGGGLAGATAAETLRNEGFDGTIQIVAGEPHPPYLRPPLSKEYFTGKAERETIFVQSAEWYAEKRVEVLTGSPVVALDVVAHTVALEGGRSLAFDRLLLATGSSARRSAARGADAAGIHYLRTVDDSESLRASLSKGGQKVVIVGAGWIGLEVASAARGYGNDVTIMGMEKIPLQGPLGEEIGTVFQEVHEANGVTFVLPRSIREFEVQMGHVTGVFTDAGELLPATIVVVGMGAIPNTQVAEAAGLSVDNGLVVDEHLAASLPDVFGAGDIANAYSPIIKRRMRNEHWANAIGTGKVAALSMLGKKAVFDEIPYFYTDQFDLGMEYSGYPPLMVGATVVIRGDKATREFVAFWVADGRVVAGMNLNVWDVNETVQKLIRARTVVDPARLADTSIALDSLVT